MKTLLIRPDTPKLYGVGGQCAFPIGLGYIAAVLEKQHDVAVIDMMANKLSNSALADKVSSVNPDVVGITSDTLTFQRAIDVAEVVKQVNNKIITVVGGAHCNVLPDYPLKYNCFDISVYGEGERTSVELWDRLENNKSYDDVNGIAFRRGNSVVTNPKQELIEDLNALPLPARHLFPMNRYVGMHTMGTSRGCPFSCSYCSNNVVWSRRYRFRNTEGVVGEIRSLVDEYGAKEIYFREDLFTINRDRVIDLCTKIRDNGLHFSWECESRVDTVDREMLTAMKDVGCKLIWFGVESGSQRMLDYLNKHITLSQIRNTYKLCHDVGIKAGASFMIGVPSETDDDIRATISLAKEVKPEFAWFNIFTGYPTSPLYEHTKKNGLYEKEINHGILIVKDRRRLEKAQAHANRVADRRLNKIWSEIKQGNITPQRIVRGVKYLLGH